MIRQKPSKEAVNALFTVVNGIRLYYERFDGRGTPTVLMHGWGADCSVMRGLFDELAAQNKSVVMFDFPYFGKSDPPPAHFGVYEYAETAVLFLKEQGFADVNLLGHSFGGRIALILAGRYGIGKKLILADAAGLKPKRTLKYRWKVFIYKLKKCFGRAPENAGSADYNALPDFMKPVFVRVVNTHLDRLLPRIKSPALLIWGENDRDTPLYMANKMVKKIPDSGLVTLENAGHFSFLDRPARFYAVMKSFLNHEQCVK